MNIKQENLTAAYRVADENGKNMLKALCPDIDFITPCAPDNRPVTERIKTFEDALNELGDEHPFVIAWNSIYQGCEDMSLDADIADVLAYHKLRIICAALNEDWTPQFTEDEWRYYPWFWLYTQDEIDKMDEEEKEDRRIIPTGDYQTEYAGFACANSSNAPSNTTARVGSHLCLKSDALAVYCGKQFIELWADFTLIRK